MDDDRWCRLAFALGMPYGEVRRPSPEATKFAQQVRSRKAVSSEEMTDLLAPLLASLVKRHKSIRGRRNTVFHREGVPDQISDCEVEEGWRMQLPTPRPAFVLGYPSRAFTPHHLELQQGIIVNSKNEPCDLYKLSQPVSDVYWPFFIVEVQERSMLAARNACAGSAATCNNAVMMFAGAAHQPAKHHDDVNFLWNLSKAAQSFSFAINGKTACLNTHNSEGRLPHAVAVIKTYRLDEACQVEAMASRISSVLTWAENSRLGSISDLLDAFGQRVQFPKSAVSGSDDLYAPSELLNFGVVPRPRIGIFKSVVAESLPRWARGF